MATGNMKGCWPVIKDKLRRRKNHTESAKVGAEIVCLLRNNSRTIYLDTFIESSPQAFSQCKVTLFPEYNIYKAHFKDPSETGEF